MFKQLFKSPIRRGLLKRVSLGEAILNEISVFCYHGDDTQIQEFADSILSFATSATQDSDVYPLHFLRCYGMSQEDIQNILEELSTSYQEVIRYESIIVPADEQNLYILNLTVKLMLTKFNMRYHQKAIPDIFNKERRACRVSAISSDFIEILYDLADTNDVKKAKSMLLDVTLNWRLPKF